MKTKRSLMSWRTWTPRDKDPRTTMSQIATPLAFAVGSFPSFGVYNEGGKANLLPQPAFTPNIGFEFTELVDPSHPSEKMPRLALRTSLAPFEHTITDHDLTLSVQGRFISRAETIGKMVALPGSLLCQWFVGKRFNPYTLVCVPRGYICYCFGFQDPETANYGCHIVTGKLKINPKLID